MKKNKGITLIALVVTIIVLLLLAGISINMIVGQNGLLGQATDAKNKTKEAEAREEVELAYSGALINKTRDDSIEISEDMEESLRDKDENVDVFGEEVISVYYKGYDFEIINEKVAEGTVSQKEVVETPEINDEKAGDIKDVGSNGTEEAPYKVSSIEDLIAFSDNIEKGLITSESTVVVLDTTLDFASSKSYVESNRTSLTTTLLDGSTVNHDFNGSTIKEYLYDQAKFLPLGVTEGFGGTFDGQENCLKNVNMYVSSAEDENGLWTAGLFVENDGVIKNLKTTGNVKVLDEEKYWYEVGGIAGENTGTIINTINEMNITYLEHGGYIGGIIGYNEGNVVNCGNTGNIIQKITGENRYYFEWAPIAGIVGEHDDGVVENCYNTGSITSINGNEIVVGGIIGVSYQDAGTDIKKCYNTGTITLKNTMNNAQVGGIIGENSENGIKDCYNLGKINIQDVADYKIISGGIVGYEGILTTLENNYDNSGIGAVGGRNFEGKAQQAEITLAEVIECINNEKTPRKIIPVPEIQYKNSEIAKLKPGDYVSYNCGVDSYTGTWQVLSNDGTNVEIISSDIVKNVTLGKKGDLNKCAEDYKNAVKILNEESIKYLNTNCNWVKSARSVGSSNNSQNTINQELYDSNNRELDEKKYYYQEKLTDYYFNTDWLNMLESGTAAATSNSNYWLAGRYSRCFSTSAHFYVRYTDGPGDWHNSYLFGVYSASTLYTSTHSLGLRPVVTLESDIRVVEDSLNKDGHHWVIEK